VKERLGPGAWLTLRLVLGMRFTLFTRQLGGRGAIGAIFGALVATGMAAGLGLGAWWLFARVDVLSIHPVWMAFSLGLFFFLLGLFWVIWPVIAAQVNEAHEMGRYFQFPVRPIQLYAIHTGVGLLEPSVLFFYPILAGALIGLGSSLRPGWGAALGLTLCFVLMCVATGRCLLNLMLNVMTSRRSGEILFAFFLVFLGLAAMLPPVDASWLFERLGSFGSTPEDLNLLANTARALGATPPGLLGRGLAAAASGESFDALGAGAMMLTCAGIAWLIGLWLLLRFYRGGRGLRLFPRRRSRPQTAKRGSGWKLPFISEPVSAVFEKELRTLVSNPKGRMLFAVPFFLLIILKIVGAAQLFRYLWGDAWAATLWALLGLYVLSVLGGQLFVNGFGYDSHAVRWIFWTPTRPSAWLKGRNLAQALFAGVQMFGLGLTLYALMPGATTKLWALPVGSFGCGLLLLLGLGNLISIRYPRRFHFSLAHRDRPVTAGFLWMLAGLAASGLLSLTALGLAPAGDLAVNVALLGLPVLGGCAYGLLLPLAARRLVAESEALIDGITR
jgi:ABC-2 type transport system permease protein